MAWRVFLAHSPCFLVYRMHRVYAARRRRGAVAAKMCILSWECVCVVLLIKFLLRRRMDRNRIINEELLVECNLRWWWWWLALCCSDSERFCWFLFDCIGLRRLFPQNYRSNKGLPAALSHSQAEAEAERFPAILKSWVFSCGEDWREEKNWNCNNSHSFPELAESAGGSVAMTKRRWILSLSRWLDWESGQWHQNASHILSSKRDFVLVVPWSVQFNSSRILFLFRRVWLREIL